tara:strand:+ start:6143 stop:6448 length:306 start_codon:yes stop_codon:yes gene_type:complete
MKIIGLEYHTSDSYIIRYTENEEKKEMLVEYHFQEVCVSEGYEIIHPVDHAHQEPDVMKYYVHINKINHIENETILEEMYPDTQTLELIENYILENKIDTI